MEYCDVIRRPWITNQQLIHIIFLHDSHTVRAINYTFTQCYSRTFFTCIFVLFCALWTLCGLLIIWRTSYVQLLYKARWKQAEQNRNSHILKYWYLLQLSPHSMWKVHCTDCVCSAFLTYSWWHCNTLTAELKIMSNMRIVDLSFHAICLTCFI